MFVERSSVFIILLYLVIPMISSGQVKLSNDPAKIDFARPRNPVQNSLTTYSNFSGHNADFSRSLPKSISTDSTQVEWINQYNSELIPSSDIATGIAQDIAGNIYVTGQSIGINTSLDFLTIKYTSSGEKVWEARYDGPDHKDDSPVDIGVDSEGNIYVTGTSVQEGVPGTSDYVTLKYDQTGALQWAVRYDGPDQANDKAVALTLDSLGNIYITGSSYYSETATDFVTIKYNPSGIIQWVETYNGSGNDNDEGLLICIDQSDNIYVAGSSTGSGTNLDFTTIKYIQDVVNINEEILNVNEFVLEQNYPNPFNPTTTIKFALSETQKAELKIFDILGNEVANLFNGIADGGKIYKAEFSGENLPSGLYIYKLETNESVQTRKMILLR